MSEKMGLRKMCLGTEWLANATFYILRVSVSQFEENVSEEKVSEKKVSEEKSPWNYGISTADKLLFRGATHFSLARSYCTIVQLNYSSI